MVDGRKRADFDTAAEAVLDSIDDPERRELVERYIDTARWTQKSAVPMWEGQRELVASFGITADALQDFPYDVPEIGRRGASLPVTDNDIGSADAGTSRRAV